MDKRLRIAVFAGAGVAVALGAFLILRSLLSPGDGIHYVTKPVAYADIAATVSETGIVNPVNQVTVGSEV